ATRASGRVQCWWGLSRTRPSRVQSPSALFPRADISQRGVPFLPGGRYALATLEALSATALNSPPVQALEVVTSEIAPAAAAISAAIMASASLVSVTSRKSASPVVK